jgi:hypothetical protein
MKPKRPELAASGPGRVLDELERLQEALWAAEARAATLSRALRAALPLLAHANHRPEGACRKCRLLDEAQAALAD